MSDPPPMVPLSFERLDPETMIERATAFRDRMRRRRSVRQFSSDPIPEGVLEACIEAAAQAPSGAHKQPWTFVLVRDVALKASIREAAEKEERAFYGGRASGQWLEDLRPFGTDDNKPFLEDAPALIAVFAQRHGDTVHERHYYVNESVGIAVGMLLSALHSAGLAALTHTPAPMHFLRQALERPENERAFCLIPVGFPADGCKVPELSRKPLDQVLVTKG